MAKAKIAFNKVYAKQINTNVQEVIQLISSD
jgi:hypothetical protein